jgi:hypothetical protein
VKPPPSGVVFYELKTQGLDTSLFFLYNCVTIRNKTKMTVTTNERGQQNMFAKEPQMYISQSDAERYALQTHAERAELANSRWAMVGIIAGFISYAITGKLFFGIF